MTTINIRNNIFETNSSSSHSISISLNVEMLDTIYPDENGVIVLEGGDFSWGWEKFNNALTKANYIAVDNVSNIVIMNLLKKIILQHTGAKEVKFNVSGYIDHDSIGTSKNAIKSEQLLKNFIFNPKSWLFIGNDNDPCPPNFKDKEGTQYNYELCVDGFKLTEKFVNYPSQEELEDSFYTLYTYSEYNTRYSAEIINSDDSFYKYKFPFKDELGISHNSLIKINENIITLFQTNWQDNITGSKELKFEIRKI